MTTEKKMSAHGFMKKTISKAAASAAGFLEAHRQYLLTGEVAAKTAPIVAKLDAGELLPTPALIEIQQAVKDHIYELALAKQLQAEAKAEDETQGNGTKKSIKPFSAVIYDAEGKITLDSEGKEVKAFFDLPQRASDWCNRRLFDSTPGSYGETYHHGTPYESIKRDDAFAAILKGSSGAVCKTMNKSSGKLSFGVKAKQDVAKFSRG